MCSRINVVSVQVLENPAKPTDPFKMEITFEVFENIKEGLSFMLAIKFVNFKRCGMGTSFCCHWWTRRTWSSFGICAYRTNPRWPSQVFIWGKRHLNYNWKNINIHTIWGTSAWIAKSSSGRLHGCDSPVAEVHISGAAFHEDRFILPTIIPF